MPDRTALEFHWLLTGNEHLLARQGNDFQKVNRCQAPRELVNDAEIERLRQNSEPAPDDR